MDRVLVTGPNGFVGRHLREELQAAFVPFEGDVLDAAALADAVRDARPQALVHLAALSSVGQSWEDVGEVWRVNVLGTVNALEAVRAAAPGARFLFISSAEVYGRAAETPTPESAPVDPVSPYGATKAAAELACTQAAKSLDVVVARSFPHLGPGQDERFAVASWAAQLARMDDDGVLRVGNLEVRRDFTDVRDVCRAYRLLLQPTVERGTYNVASGKAVPLERVLELLVAEAGVRVKVQTDEARLRPVDVPILAGDASKLRAATGWEPAFPLQQTLAEVLQEARASRETMRIES